MSQKLSDTCMTTEIAQFSPNTQTAKNPYLLICYLSQCPGKWLRKQVSHNWILKVTDTNTIWSFTLLNFIPSISWQHLLRKYLLVKWVCTLKQTTAKAEFNFKCLLIMLSAMLSSCAVHIQQVCVGSEVYKRRNKLSVAQTYFSFKLIKKGKYSIGLEKWAKVDLTRKFFEKLKLCCAEGHVVFHQEGGGLKFKMCVCRAEYYRLQSQPVS